MCRDCRLQSFAIARRVCAQLVSGKGPCKNDSAMWPTYNTYSNGHGGCCAIWSGDDSPYGPMGAGACVCACVCVCAFISVRGLHSSAVLCSGRRLLLREL